jgi:hypothetical protein
MTEHATTTTHPEPDAATIANLKAAFIAPDAPPAAMGKGELEANRAQLEGLYAQKDQELRAYKSKPNPSVITPILVSTGLSAGVLKAADHIGNAEHVTKRMMDSAEKAYNSAAAGEAVKNVDNVVKKFVQEGNISDVANDVFHQLTQKKDFSASVSTGIETVLNGVSDKIKPDEIAKKINDAINKNAVEGIAADKIDMQKIFGDKTLAELGTKADDIKNLIADKAGELLNNNNVAAFMADDVQNAVNNKINSGKVGQAASWVADKYNKLPGNDLTRAVGITAIILGGVTLVHHLATSHQRKEHKEAENKVVHTGKQISQLEALIQRDATAAEQGLAGVAR